MNVNPGWVGAGRRRAVGAERSWGDLTTHTVVNPPRFDSGWTIKQIG
jgi:hypothetical protein